MNIMQRMPIRRVRVPTPVRPDTPWQYQYMPVHTGLVPRKPMAD
jgi:hypothetical protein